MPAGVSGHIDVKFPIFDEKCAFLAIDVKVVRSDFEHARRPAGEHRRAAAQGNQVRTSSNSALRGTR